MRRALRECSKCFSEVSSSFTFNYFPLNCEYSFVNSIVHLFVCVSTVT